MTALADKIKPCPFCGKPGVGGWFCTEYNVSCLTDGCPGSAGASAYADTLGVEDTDAAMLDAVARWNTRAEETK